jgi:hypothetical protein
VQGTYHVLWAWLIIPSRSLLIGGQAAAVHYRRAFGPAAEFLPARGCAMADLTDPGASIFRIVVRSMISDAAWKESPISDLDITWARVESVFTTFCQAKGSIYTSATVQITKKAVAANALRPFDLVVYLVDSVGQSVIKRRQRSVKLDPDATGQTFVQGALNICEVYLKHDYHSKAKLLANTVIHECMHNKLNMDDSLHNLAPSVGGNGGFAQDGLPNDTDLQPSNIDITTMAPALSKVVPQQVGV